ncbi:dihydrofolate reductase family protein [Rhodocytophaga rosea]|uniref:dihydrofolate reductase family protein n=1 Tax=Rhodocytophaga rosea TaxID=2704465 RepID=UPI003742344E
MVYGGTRFVSSLIKEDLIDEYNLLVNPTILGKGKPIFKSITSLRNLDLVSATSYGGGMVVLKYKRKIN